MTVKEQKRTEIENEMIEYYLFSLGIEFFHLHHGPKRSDDFSCLLGILHLPKTDLERSAEIMIWIFGSTFSTKSWTSDWAY